MRSKKPVRKEKGAGQKGKCYPVKNKLHFRVSQGETEKLVKVSKSVEPAGKFLLAYQKRREGKRQSLGQKSEINSTHATTENQVGKTACKRRRHQHDG